MKITLEVSEDNEATEAPWWAIVDPAQNMKADLAVAAGQIAGPFFSRKAAEDELKATRYNYSKRAQVWCFSGYRSYEYKQACRAGAAREPSLEELIIAAREVDRTMRMRIDSPADSTGVMALRGKALGDLHHELTLLDGMASATLVPEAAPERTT